MKSENLSPKLMRIHYEGADGGLTLHEHWCPGCNMLHQIAVDRPFRNGHRWSFNGNAERPTFSPSVNVWPGNPQQCHYFIRDGRIQFCADSKHALAGKTVDLPDIPESERW